METQVQKFIDAQQLLPKGSSVLVGVSGGADSIALCLVLTHLGYRVSAVHCNFHLRGEESDRDERFVCRFCEEQNLPLNVKHFDTKAYAKTQKVSIEMAARELRYSYFQELLKELKISVLAVAHHQDDQAETLLINLIRGTGIHGLRGMKPKNGYIIRPLLCVDREAILHYLKQQNQEFVTDSSNLSTDYTRNKIRLELIPYLKKLNPSIVSGLNQTAQNMLDVEQFVEESVQEMAQKSVLSPSYELGKTPLTLQRVKNRAFLYEMLTPYGFTEAQISSILQEERSVSGKVFLSKNWKLLVDRNTFEIQPVEDYRFKSIIINETDNYIQFEKGTLEIKKIALDNYPEIEKKKEIALLDFQKIRFPLILRQVQTGDKFVPFGMKGKKLVSDFLTNLKLSLWEKQQQQVLCDATGEIIWVVGQRISAHFAISSSTRLIYRIALFYID